MKKLKFKSLTLRIWTIFTLVILAIICCISLLYVFAYKNIDESAKIKDLKVAHNVTLTSTDSSQPMRFDLLQNLKGINYFVASVGSDDKLYFNDKFDMQPPPGMIKEDGLRKWMAGYIKNTKMSEEQFKGTFHNTKYIFIISSSKVQGGDGYLVSYVPLREDNSIFYTVLITGAVFIIIGLAISKAVASYIAKPLRELEAYTVRIAKKNWTAPIQSDSEDEIGRLIVSMNDMQKELKHADEEEKMFLQSISHDLKTPVMVIMSHAEAIIDGVYIESVEKTAEIIKEEAVVLERKIKQLLYLNTLDYSLENNLEKEEVDLRKVVMHIVNRFEIINSKIEWDLELEDITIISNEEKLKVAIENILENGLRYAESKIVVTLKQEGEFAILDLYNDGPNIKPQHIDHIFKNFYKDKTGNFGLGLAITKKIIDFFKGDIVAVNREKGVSFQIKYPILKTPKE